MKNLFKNLPILVVFVIASGFTLDATDNTREDKDRIEVSFNSKMEFNDLVKIKLDLAEAGITIQYRLLEFDDQGGLKSMDSELIVTTDLVEVLRAPGFLITHDGGFTEITARM
jgi:hypothetical protein